MCCGLPILRRESSRAREAPVPTAFFSEDSASSDAILRPQDAAYLFLRTRIGLISSLSMGATRSWMAASSAEAK
jgi:hypothetical protein